jgi:hypothetical protein
VLDTAHSIGSKELEVLQYWLSVRYRRAAFADTFVDRMGTTGLDKIYLGRMRRPPWM